MRQGIALKKFVEPLVADITVPVTSAKPVLPRFLGVLVHHLQDLEIAPHPEILIKPPQLAAQGFVLLAYGIVPVFLAPAPQHAHKAVAPFARGFLLDRPVARKAFTPVKGKPQKIEGPLGLCLARRLSECDQTGLLRMQGERETLEAPRQHFHQPLGVRLQLESDDKVVGKTNDEALALHTRLDRLDEPVVQHVVQKDITERR